MSETTTAAPETVPETTPTGPAPNQPPQTPGGEPKPLLAGKYETTEALEQGIREIAGSLGYELGDGPIIGPNGTYKSTQEAVAAYKALERMKGRAGRNAASEPHGHDQPDEPPGPKRPAAADDPLQIPDQPDIDDDLTVTSVLERAGLTPEEIRDEWTQNGRLTDQQYAALASQGFPRGVVDEYIRIQQLAAQAIQQQQAQIRQQAAEIVGGEQQLRVLIQSARSFVPPDEIDDLNQRLADPRRFKGALRDIMEHHRNAVKAGRARPLAQGGATTAAPGGRITSRNEYFSTIRAARAGDPEARARLEAHIRAGGGRFA